MASVNKTKRNFRRKPPIIRGSRAILNDYSDEDREYSSPNEELANLGSNQGGWRKISRGNTVHGAGINDTIANATRHTSSSSALANDLRNKRIRAELPHTLAPVHDECFNSSKRSSTLRNNAHNEVVDETGTRNLQGSDHLQFNNSVRANSQSEDHCLSDMETSAGNSNTDQGRSVGRRGVYKGLDLDKLTDGRKNKLIVSIPPGKCFRPLGKYRNKLSSWLGYCARICGPPIEPWNQIEKKNRHKLWAMVQDYFDVSSDSPEKWKKLEELGKVESDTLEMKRAKFELFCFGQMQKSYGKWKNKLYKKYLMYPNDDERLKHVPEELSPDDWKEMLKVFASEDFQERSRINSENRRSQKVVTSTGPKPFAQVEYDMMDEELGEIPKASDVWKATHGISDDHGQIAFRDSESIRIYEDLQMVENQPVNDDEPVPTPDHVLQQVVGVRSGYVRGKGFGYKAITKGMVSNGKNNEVNVLKSQLAKVTAELEEQKERRKEQEERERERDRLFEVHRKEQEERERERDRLFESYFKRMDSMVERNSSRSTQNASEERFD